MIFDGPLGSGNTSGKVQCVWIAAVPAIPNAQSPKTFDRNRTVAGLQGAQKAAGSGIEGIDPAIAKVSNQKVIRKRAECARRDRESPRRIEHSIVNDALKKISV